VGVKVIIFQADDLTLQGKTQNKTRKTGTTNGGGGTGKGKLGNLSSQERTFAGLGGEKAFPEALKINMSKKNEAFREGLTGGGGELFLGWKKKFQNRVTGVVSEVKRRTHG